MDEKIDELGKPKEEPIEVDDWQKAFAALEPTPEPIVEGTETKPGEPADTATADTTPDLGNKEDQSAVPDNTGNVPVDTGNTGGSVPPDPGTPSTPGDPDPEVFTEEDVKLAIKEIDDEMEIRVVKDVAQAFIKKGYYNSNGQLGATMAHTTKYDDSGKPIFYNPDTGEQFTGPNPRAQARQWLDDYNKGVMEDFNQVAGAYKAQLEEQSAPTKAMIQFEPIFDQLDPVRQGMFEELIKGYEIIVNGEHIGYSCDLNKALEQVNNQITRIQSFATNNGQAQPTSEKVPPAKQSPLTDMPAGAGTTKGGKPEFKSVEEAMAYEQDKLLAQLKEKK